MKLQGIRRRIVYVGLYEAIAIAVSSLGLKMLSGRPMTDALVAAVGASVIAVIWNYIFNTLFERWEARQRVKGRNFWRRIAHAIGFEGGLIALLVPLFAWKLQVSLWEAFVMDLGLIVFFLIYTFCFTWGFDRIFGLPESAKMAHACQTGTPRVPAG
ncbi:membrane protein [Lampropedia cohaerens]|uniref:Membrane protein n=1 Tax=Lampropedia cohaerens TaxID=1610491 RepID=A0A0U1Q3I4_9BURK|nr:PACE efflux transporter [Lampropedia cohaerens]KKW69319.1 membrane protein [Lampropedia cohaerens]